MSFKIQVSHSEWVSSCVCCKTMHSLYSYATTLPHHVNVHTSVTPYLWHRAAQAVWFSPAATLSHENVVRLHLKPGWQREAQS